MLILAAAIFLFTAPSSASVKQGLAAWQKGASFEQVENLAAGRRKGYKRSLRLTNFWVKVVKQNPIKDPSPKLSSIDFRSFEAVVYLNYHGIMAGKMTYAEWQKLTAIVEKKALASLGRATPKQSTDSFTQYDQALIWTRKKVTEQVTAAKTRRISFLLEANGLGEEIGQAMQHASQTSENIKGGVWLKQLFDDAKRNAKPVDPSLTAVGMGNYVAAELKKQPMKKGLSNARLALLLTRVAVSQAEQILNEKKELKKWSTRLNDFRKKADAQAKADYGLLDRKKKKGNYPYEDYVPSLSSIKKQIAESDKILNEAETYIRGVIKTSTKKYSRAVTPDELLRDLEILEMMVIDYWDTGTTKNLSTEKLHNRVLKLLKPIPSMYKKSVLRRLTKDKNYKGPESFPEVQKRVARLLRGNIEYEVVVQP